MIPSSTQVLASISDWGARLVAPLEAPLVSKDGMLEIAGRVYWIFPLVIAAVIVAWKYGYLTGRTTPPDSSSITPKNEPVKRTDWERSKQRVEKLERLFVLATPTDSSSTTPKNELVTLAEEEELTQRLEQVERKAKWPEQQLK
jgi:hypothetical protein